MTDCTCPLAGWCARHQRDMSDREYELCQGTGGFAEEFRTKTFAYWARLAKMGVAKEPAKPIPRVGTELGKVLKEWGITDTGCSGCAWMSDQMNRWGPECCREHRAEIVEHLRKQATKKGWTGKALAWLNPGDVFGSLVDEAIRRAENTLG